MKKYTALSKYAVYSAPVCSAIYSVIWNNYFLTLWQT